MVQVSLQTLQQVFTEDPSEPRCGLELAERTGLKSGTVYPALGRLEQQGWLTSSVEDIDPEHDYTALQTAVSSGRVAAKPGL